MRELQIDDKNALAKVIFESTLASNAARNCAHMKKMGETLMDIEYTPYTVWLICFSPPQWYPGLLLSQRWKIPVDLLTSPRAIVPIAGILVTSITLLLNPIRLYFVTQRLTVEQGIGFGPTDESVGHPGLRTFAYHRLTKSEADFKTIIDKKPSNVLLMVGPKGTTKSSMLRKVMQRYRPSLLFGFDGISLNISAGECSPLEWIAQRRIQCKNLWNCLWEILASDLRSLHWTLFSAGSVLSFLLRLLRQ